jgi:hypothetical protein
MKVGKGVRVPKSVCTACGSALDGAAVVGNDTITPKPGDVTVCIDCGHLMAFAEDLSLRDLRDDEFKEVAGDPNILAIQRARARCSLT